MGVQITINKDDAKMIKDLKKKTGAKTSVEVIREGLKLLNLEVERKERVRQWEKAVKNSKNTSKEVNEDFRKHSRIKSAP